jgi:preprotein translocase subunit Sec63
MMNTTNSDPFYILGLKPGATGDEIRSRYLQLVRENPPDREPEKFRAVNTAWKMLSDPLVQASALLNADRTTRSLAEICDAAESEKPRLVTQTLLALGNDN